MTEFTAATESKTTQPAARVFGPPNYEIPKSELPSMEIPDALSETADNIVAQAKDTYEKANVAAEQATDLIKDTYATAAKGATDYNLKILEIARINTNSTFEYAQELMRVKSPSDFVVLWAAHARKQIDRMITQTKALTELTQKVTTEIAEPLKAGVTKAFDSKLP